MPAWTNLNFTPGQILTDALLDQLQDNIECIRTFLGDSVSNYVLADTGFEGPTSANLTHTIAAGDAFIFGYWVSKAATAHTYTASKDTYVSLDYNGTYYFQEVANGAAQPTLSSGRLYLLKVVTSATQITSVKDLARRQYVLRESMWRSTPAENITVGNTTTETDLFKRMIERNFAYPVNGSEQDRKMVVRVLGQYLNNSGGSSVLTLRLKYGATTIGQLPVTVASSGVGKPNVIAEFEYLPGPGFCFSKMELGPPLDVLTDPAASATAGQVVYGKCGDITENWQDALELTVTVQHSVANVGISFDLLKVTVELV